MGSRHSALLIANNIIIGHGLGFPDLPRRAGEAVGGINGQIGGIYPTRGGGRVHVAVSEAFRRGKWGIGRAVGRPAPECDINTGSLAPVPRALKTMGRIIQYRKGGYN